MATNVLTKARENKADEFYTQLSDIEAEMRHYKEQLRGKVILCNCDDPYESNFFKYFAMNFNHLGLKRLIATCFTGSPIAGQELSLFDVEGIREGLEGPKHSYKMEISEVIDENADGAFDLTDVAYLLKNRKNTLTLLDGDGDFRSQECLELLKEADIVITNPPFSLFREYVAQLIESEKKFIIIGNKNSITYKEVFSSIMLGKMWLGYRSINEDMWFIVPEGYEYEKMVNGLKLKHIMGCWFTNLDTTKRHEQLTLYKKYNPEEYLHYDNYDAINIDKVAEIPYDFEGPMGVPITFLDKFNPDQFEILGITSGRDEFEATPTKRYINPKQINKDGTISNGSKANTRATLLLSEKPSGIYYTAENAEGPLQILYARIIIRRKGAVQ